MPSKLQVIIGSVILVIAIFSGVVVEFEFSKEYTAIKRDGVVLAKERWHIESERTLISLEKCHYEIDEATGEKNRICKSNWYAKNIKCPKIIELGGHISASGKSCIYPNNYYETLKRSLIKTKIEVEETTVIKSVPHYAYGSRGSYAGYLIETMEFTETDNIEEFPEKYNINWKPKDTRNYKLVWRVDDIKDLNLEDGIYNGCKYQFGNLKIDLGKECNKLNKAVVKGNDMWFYFNAERGEQNFNLGFVDPTIFFSDTFTDNDNTLLENHLPDTGTGWHSIYNVSSTNLKVKWDRVYIQTGANSAGHIYAIDDTLPQADYNVSTTSGDTSGDDTITLIARWADSDNTYGYRFSATASTDYNTLFSKVGGVLTILNSTSNGVSGANTITLEVIGTQLTAYESGAVLCSASDSNLSSAGKAGLGIGAFSHPDDDGSAQYGDNFKVEYDVASDSCTAPASPANWAVDINDNCTTNAEVNITGYNISYYCTGICDGSHTINATIYLDEILNGSLGMMINGTPNGIIYGGEK